MSSTIGPMVGSALNNAEMALQDKVLGAQVSEKDRAEIKKLANEFEAMFHQIMLKSMRDAVPKSELIDGGNGEDIFRSMLDTEYAKSMAEQRTSGIAASIENELLGLSRYNKVASPNVVGHQVKI